MTDGFGFHGGANRDAQVREAGHQLLPSSGTASSCEFSEGIGHGRFAEPSGGCRSPIVLTVGGAAAVEVALEIDTRFIQVESRHVEHGSKGCPKQEWSLLCPTNGA